MAAGNDGTTIGIDYNGAIYVFDGFDQVWRLLPGWVDPSSGSVAVGDREHVYVSYGGYMWHFNNSIGNWEGLGWSNIVKIGGWLYGLDSAGALYYWGAYGWVPFGGLTDPPMSQIAQGDYLGIVGISNNVLYSVQWNGYGQYLQWTYVPTPFTPVSVTAGTNAVMALDTAGNLWKLTSTDISYYPPSVSATWSLSTQLPAGLNQVAVGGPNDIYAFGIGQYVQRFFPNTTVEVDDYIAEDYASLLPPNLPNGGQFSFSGSATEKRSCYGRPYVTILSSSWSSPITIGGAYTKEVWGGGFAYGWCLNVAPACYNTATPQCVPGPVYVGSNGSCSPAWNTYWLTYKLSSEPVHCVSLGLSLPTSDTSPEWCTPAQ